MQALERLLRIIEAVAAEPVGRTPTEVAAESQLSLSTTARIMIELAGEQVIEKSELTGRYRLGDRLLRIVQTSTGRLDDHEVLRQLMTSLRDLSGETVSLNVRLGAQRVCIETVPSEQPVARFIPVGQAQPLIDSSSGEVLLAALPDAELRGVLKLLPVSSQEIAELRRRLDQVRADGYAIHTGKLVPGVTGVAVPVQTFGSRSAALGVSGPQERFTVEAVHKVLPELISVAKQISNIPRVGP